MRIAVLGGDGFVGWPTSLHLSNLGHEIHIVDNLSRRWIDTELGVQSLTPIRTTRSTQLTRAGRLFLEHVPRVFASIEQARDSVRSAANGFHGQLRIALSDGITPSRLPALLAQCR